MRAAVVASIAAGASVAAAWGLTVAPVPGARTPSARVPVASFGPNTVSVVNFGGSVIPGNRVTPVTSQTRSESAGGNVPYWFVATRATNRAPGSGSAAGAAAPFRVADVGSAQSGP
jgi:hypothetical protein